MKSAQLLVIILCLLVAACATATPGERHLLISKDVSCEEAEEYIDSLKTARPSSGERTRSILQTVTPIGLITGLLFGQIDDRAKVAIGHTSRQIDEQVEAIEQLCLREDHPEYDGGVHVGY